MKKNKDYSFLQIETFANDENYELTELGGQTIGESFIVLKHNEKDLTISFILTGYISAPGIFAGNQYTCIYTDKEYSI
jgi:hypothetical protein